MSQILNNSVNSVRYKVVSNDGTVLSVEPSKILAEMFVNKLTEDQKKTCVIVPITEDNKDILLG